jgi:hypothetical protein
MFVVAMALPATAQQVWYEGPAVWIPVTGAVEKFQHARRDTNLQLTGKYFWQLREELPGGALRLVRIAAQFKNGRIDGHLLYTQHDLQLEVGDIAADSLLVQAKGQVVQLQAHFQQGKASGQWLLEQGTYPRIGQPTTKITFSPASQQFSYAGVAGQLTGKINQSGAVQGPWKWQQDSLVYEYQYESGRLTAIRQQEQLMATAAFRQLEQLLRAEHNLRWERDSSSRFDPGLASNDSILILQQPWSVAFSGLRTLLDGPWSWLQRHPRIQLPLMPAISGVFIPLDTANLPQATMAELERYRDSTQKCLQAPSLQLRIGQDAALDQLYAEAQLAQQQADSLLAAYRAYLAPASRRQLFLSQSSPANYLPQAAVLSSLKTAAAQAIGLLDDYAAQLFNFRQQFREEAALTALESAWLATLNRLSELKPDSAYAVGLQLWTNLQQGHLQAQKEAYTALQNLEQRRQFLRGALDEAEGLLRYFELQAYPFLTTAPADFQKAYTQMLYNPYMGVNNIEQVNRRRLLTYFKVDFWPWWCEQLQQVARPQQLFEAQETAKLLYEAIMALGTDDSREANRLEKRIRREKSPERVVRLLLDYQRRQEGRAQAANRLIFEK